MIEGNVHPAAHGGSALGLQQPVIRTITASDVHDAFSAAMADWRETPLLGMLFGLVYAVAGAILLAILSANDRTYLIVPALSAFLLVGPGIALGLYEIARRHETEEPIEPAAIFSAGMRHGGTQIAVFGVILAIIAVLWLVAATIIHTGILGSTEFSFPALVRATVTTADGARYAFVGTAVGAIFAAVTFCISVVGAPMLLDRDVDAWTAASTSFAAVRQSPFAFLVYGVLVTVIIAAGLAAFLVGLLVALPVVGFATWHLYRRAVAW